MALTPDDLLTKRFEETRFRDGYDQDEVDDFLDLVASDWRTVIAERDALREENERLKQQLASAATEAPIASAPAPEAAPAAEPQAPEAPVSAPAAPSAAEADYQPSADSSLSLLTMAQRLHDELVQKGENQRDTLVAEGEQKRDELVSSAEAEKKRIEDEALARGEELEREHNARTAELEQQRVELQEKIDELKSFERDYRLRLRGYIESQLRDLDRTSSLGNVAVDGSNNA